MEFTLEELYTKKEGQTYDRKSARKDPKGLSNHIVAFANADGGMLVIGIEDDFTVTGIDNYHNNVNDILRVPFDYCTPSVRVTTETVECTDKNGNPNHLLVMTIPQSSELHANQQDEVYYRMGDKSKKLNFDERLQLMYAKGSRYCEDEPVYRSSMEDIDWDFVAEYCKKIGYPKSAVEYIRQNNDFVVNHNGREEMSGAAILLFGKNPQRFFKRARVRFILIWFVTLSTLYAAKSKNTQGLVKTVFFIQHLSTLNLHGKKSSSTPSPTAITALREPIYKLKCLMIGLRLRVPVSCPELCA